MARQEALPDGTIITLERYAQLSGEVIDPVRTVLRVIEAEADPDGTNGEWVLCGDAGPDWTTADNGLTFTAPVIPPPPADPCEWLMDLGPFADRLGAHAFEVDTSTVPGVIAVAKDLARRKWVDLQDPRVAASLYYLAGHTVPVLGTLAAPILTDAEVVAILTTPVPLEANRALRKVYFS